MATMTGARLDVARALAQTLLVGDRWQHTMGVARRAAEVAATVPATDRDVLLVAAWLHDIGYSPIVAVTGFHCLDGADYLDRQGWPRRVCALVAHHSGARFVAEGSGMREAIDAYAAEQSPVADALTYADQTTGPRGETLTIERRIADMLARHGPGSVQARMHHVRGPYLLGAAARVNARLGEIAAVR